MTRYLFRRIGAGILTLWVVSILIFIGTEVVPGDVATAILGRSATPEALETVRERLELDRPAAERYWGWFTGAIQGDLGESSAQTLASGRGAPMWPLISGRLENSAILAVATMILLIPLGLGLGILAAIHAGRRLDHGISAGSLSAMSLPEFVTGALLILVFSVWLDLLPGVSLLSSGTSPLGRPEILVLPVITLLLVSLAHTIRMIRAGMIEVLDSQYIEMARLSGHPEHRIVRRHALRNALAPTVMVIALTVQWLVGGIIVTEVVFGYPGLGQAMVQSVESRDVGFVQSVAMLIATIYVALNIIADLLVVFLIPKLRTAP
ncbi:MAG: ABC transporter permease [Actinomycetia bacterium]|nr:ABC transporter permease [Actinomycetes bacterium]